MEVERTGLQDYFALLHRRRSSMFIVFAVISIATVFGTLLLDDQYQSTATIAIERPAIPENMVRTTVATYDTDLRIDRIRDLVLVDEYVAPLIEEFGLYEDIVAEESIGDAAAAFRKDVEIIKIQAREDVAVKNQGETIAFDVSYYGETPEKALLVAARLADQFLAENRRSRNQSVEDTLAFFQRDADRLAKRIVEAEAKLADFKERNSGALPDSANINAQMLDRAERELDDIEREIRDLREQRKILETELSKLSPDAPIFTAAGEAVLSGPDRLKFLQQQYIELSSKYSPEHPDVVRTRREIELLSDGGSESDVFSIHQELELVRREYEMALQRYTADHPDVRTLANRVDILETRLAAIGTSLQKVTNTQPDNPAYISIMVQIEGTDTEIEALRRRAQNLQGRIGRYESLLLQSPQVEREFLALERQYDQAVSEFNEVREKQTEAQQARQLEVSEKGERYVVQRMPSKPKSAAFPNRLAIILLGIIFAIGSSFGAVLVSEGLDSSVRSIRDLKHITGMPPLAVVPVIESRSERKKRTMIWSLSGLGTAVLLIYMIVIQVL